MKTLMAFDANKAREAAAAGHTAELLRDLEKRYGVVFDGRLGRIGFMVRDSADLELREALAADGSIKLTCDAQPELATINNVGIPAYLTNYMDPKVIKALVAPMRATEIVGSEEKKGDWTTTFATFTTLELIGETSAYGDFNSNGMSDANVNFPQRQSFYYQTFTNWGERQSAMWSLGKIDYASSANEASILVLNKYQNGTYFFGVSGLQNYGLLNDPALPAAIVATALWNASATTPEQIYEDVRRMFVQLQFQTQGSGVIGLDAPITLAMSPILEPALDKTNQYGLSARNQLTKHFPNINVKTAPEYSTASGELIQMIAREVEGQKTATTAFTEKMRAHAVVTGSSSWSQKKSQGTFGTVIFNPYAISSMTGAG